MRARASLAPDASGALKHGPARKKPLRKSVDNPPASASVEQYLSADLPWESDSVAGQSLQGSLQWCAVMENDGDLPIANPMISVDGSCLTFTPPVASWPLTATQSTLASSSLLSFDELDGFRSVENVAFTPPYDVQRALSPEWIPAGGVVETQAVTISVTLQQAVTSLVIMVAPGAFGGSIEASSVVQPAVSGGETVDILELVDLVQCSVGNPVVGWTYVLTLNVSVANPAGNPAVFKPGVRVDAGTLIPQTASTGTSSAISDPVLGGTFTFSSLDITDWQPAFWAWQSTFLAGLPVEASMVDSFRVTVDGVHGTTAPGPSSWWLPRLRLPGFLLFQTVEAGEPFGVTVSALDFAGDLARGFVGPVTIADTAGLLTFAPLTWADGVGTTTAVVQTPYRNDCVTVTDARPGSTATGTSRPFDVAGPLEKFDVAVTQFPAPPAGWDLPVRTPTGRPQPGAWPPDALSLAVVSFAAKDADGATAIGYTGSPKVSDDLGGMRVRSGTQQPCQGGVGGVWAAFAVAGTDRVTVQDGAAVGQSAQFTVP